MNQDGGSLSDRAIEAFIAGRLWTAPLSTASQRHDRSIDGVAQHRALLHPILFRRSRQTRGKRVYSVGLACQLHRQSPLRFVRNSVATRILPFFHQPSPNGSGLFRSDAIPH